MGMMGNLGEFDNSENNADGKVCQFLLTRLNARGLPAYSWRKAFSGSSLTERRAGR
jgi:hypothetical protein